MKTTTTCLAFGVLMLAAFAIGAFTKPPAQPAAAYAPIPLSPQDAHAMHDDEMQALAALAQDMGQTQLEIDRIRSCLRSMSDRKIPSWVTRPMLVATKECQGLK